MAVIFNLLCKTFISFLDILLLNLFLKNSFSYIYHNNIKKLRYIIYMFIFIITLFIKNTVTYIFIHIIIIMLLSIVLSFFQTNKINVLIKIILYYFFILIIQIFTTAFFSWLLNTTIFTYYPKTSLIYTILSHIISNYIIYTIIVLYFRNRLAFHFKFFKFLSICVFIFFIIVFIIKNPVLLYIPEIHRTYIFTVVISIVALICFDRMQAKYEAEKYSQEAIIQNMKKEKSFNEQRAKRQEEIKKINHNLVNILAITQSHISDQEYEKAQDYLSKTIQSVVEEYNALNHSGIDSLDGIIQEKMSIMKENGIRYDEEISKLLHFGNIDLDNLGLIIDLFLDKAIEEVMQISSEKYIRLTLQSKQTHIILHISHPIDKQHSRFHVHNQSSHHDLAFKQIETITKRYHGDIKYDTTDNEVILRVILEK